MNSQEARDLLRLIPDDHLTAKMTTSLQQSIETDVTRTGWDYINHCCTNFTHADQEKQESVRKYWNIYKQIANLQCNASNHKDIVICYQECNSNPKTIFPLFRTTLKELGESIETKSYEECKKKFDMLKEEALQQVNEDLFLKFLKNEIEKEIEYREL